jgi:hypothetical protein
VETLGLFDTVAKNSVGSNTTTPLPALLFALGLTGFALAERDIAPLPFRRELNCLSVTNAWRIKPL